MLNKLLKLNELIRNLIMNKRKQYRVEAT